MKWHKWDIMVIILTIRDIKGQSQAANRIISWSQEVFMFNVCITKYYTVRAERPGPTENLIFLGQKIKKFHSIIIF